MSLFKDYFREWWMPSVVFLCSAVIECCVELVFAESSERFLGGFFFKMRWIAFCMAWVAILLSRVKGATADARLSCGAIICVGLLSMCCVSMVDGCVADGGLWPFSLGDSVHINDCAAAKRPQVELYDSPLQCVDDDFARELAMSYDNPGNIDERVNCDVSSLFDLAEKKMDLLCRYLASHPAWRFRRKDGAPLAVRRMKFRDFWYVDSNDDMEFRLGRRASSYLKVKIGFPGIHERSMGTDIGISCYVDGKLKNVKYEKCYAENGSVASPSIYHRSMCDRLANWLSAVICSRANAPCVFEVEECQPLRKRCLSNASIKMCRTEFDALLACADWNEAKKLLPKDAIKVGKPSLDLVLPREGFARFEAHVNPGEPGLIYVDVFESGSRGAIASGYNQFYTREYVGWSDNPDELFFAGGELFSLGEKENYIRLEVWFVPDANKPKRMLISRTFNVHR